MLGLGLLVILALVGFRVTLVRSGDNHPKRIVLPGQLRRHLLFYADADRTEIVRVDGTVVETFPKVAGVGYPVRPMATPQHLVMFVHDHHVYRVGSDGHGPAELVGAGDRLFPADGGNVGLEAGPGLGAVEPTFVEYVAGDATVPQPGTTRTQLPLGSSAVARLVDGLLVLSSDGHLRFASPGPSVNLGPVNYVIATSVVSVAWTAHSGCKPDSTDCPLHLSETAGGSDRVVQPPAGFGGFVGGGGFSPDGVWLAAFVYAPAASAGAGDIRLALINHRDSGVQLIGPSLPAGEPLGSAAWSPDGKWLFFSGLGGPMYAQQVGLAGPVGSPVALPVPASYSFAPL